MASHVASKISNLQDGLSKVRSFQHADKSGCRIVYSLCDGRFDGNLTVFDPPLKVFLVFFDILRPHVLVKYDKPSDCQSPLNHERHIANLICLMGLKRGLRYTATRDCMMLISCYQVRIKEYLPIRPKLFIKASAASNVSPPTLS